MRRVLRIILLPLLLLSSQPVLAQQSSIQDVIRKQIDAFRSDDFDSAFAYASPDIRRMFGSPEIFGQMVRNGYPMVWRPSALRFLEQREEGEMIWQRVLIQDAQGRVHMLEYQMLETVNGWKINAVQMLPATGLAV